LVPYAAQERLSFRDLLRGLVKDFRIVLVLQMVQVLRDALQGFALLQLVVVLVQ
jgi:hypothetical protein